MLVSPFDRQDSRRNGGSTALVREAQRHFEVYLKFENVVEVRQWRREKATELATQLTIAHTRDKFDVRVTVHLDIME
jgi:hypothetical protein